MVLLGKYIFCLLSTVITLCTYLTSITRVFLLFESKGWQVKRSGKVAMSHPLCDIFFISGPYKMCPTFGLSSTLAPNLNLHAGFLYTYRQATEMCKQAGMVLSNNVDPWTRTCSEPLRKSIQKRFGSGLRFWDNNDIVRKNQPLAKHGVICTYLNWY